ncbi:Dynein Heavy Chain 8, Axonemal [Manis pentadactyla]|nr:Dynein Heavy Chain 8, Axonemal [Manis pentadactyla]
MVNQDLKRGFEFADALFREVCRGSPSQINSLCRAEEEEKDFGAEKTNKKYVRDHRHSHLCKLRPLLSPGSEVFEQKEL